MEDLQQERRFKNKHIVIVMKNILFVSCVLLTLLSCEFYVRKQTYNMDVKGVIVNKYIDKKQHNSEIYIIKKYTGENYFLLANYFYKLWDYAEIGDTIIKNPGSFDLMVIKNNGEKKTFNHYK